MALRRCRFLAVAWLILSLYLSRRLSAQVTIAGDDTVPKQIILFGRHGVRSAAFPDATLAAFATRPYPSFGVPTGYLTPHGAQAEVLLGSYFREYLLNEGLLTGDLKQDVGRSYFRANSIQRSNVSAASLGSGLFPGVTVGVHSYPLGTPDPVFDPISAKVVTVDANRAVYEVKGIFNNGPALQSAYRAEFSLIRSVLFNYPNESQPPPPVPAGLTDATSLPTNCRSRPASFRSCSKLKFCRPTSIRFRVRMRPRTYCDQ